MSFLRIVQPRRSKSITRPASPRRCGPHARGKGIRGVRSREQGDLLCHVIVETPVNLTERQRELLREFEVISQKDSDRHNPRAKSWMDKVKEFFAQ